MSDQRDPNKPDYCVYCRGYLVAPQKRINGYVVSYDREQRQRSVLPTRGPVHVCAEPECETAAEIHDRYILHDALQSNKWMKVEPFSEASKKEAFTAAYCSLFIKEAAASPFAGPPKAEGD